MELPKIQLTEDPRLIIDYRYLIIPEFRPGFNIDLIRLLCRIPSYKFIEEHTPELLKFTPPNDILNMNELLKTIASKTNLNLYLYCSSRVTRNLEFRLELLAALNALGLYPSLTSQILFVFYS